MTYRLLHILIFCSFIILSKTGQTQEAASATGVEQIKYVIARNVVGSGGGNKFLRDGSLSFRHPGPIESGCFTRIE